MLLSCVRLSVRLPQAGIVSKRLDESSWFWHVGFLPLIQHCVISKYSYLQKLGNYPLRLCPNSGLNKFLRGKSIALSTKLVVVDGRACWRHLYDNRRVVAVYYKSINCNPLTPYCDMLWTCFYGWQDFDWHSALRGPSAVAKLLVLFCLKNTNKQQEFDNTDRTAGYRSMHLQLP